MKQLAYIAVRMILGIALIIAEAWAAVAQTSNPHSGGSYAGLSSASGTGTSAGAATSGYVADTASSSALTEQLKQDRLPLVGAQVLNASHGQRKVVLYGYVATDFGKSDAVTKARRYLKDSSVVVDNRIKVEPDLLAANGGSSGTTSSAPTASSPDASAGGLNPDVDSYMHQQSGAQQYAQQGSSSPSAMTAIVPLLMLGAVLLSHGSISIGNGSMGPPGSFGGAPYDPYSGYPSPPSIGSSSGGTIDPYGNSVDPYGTPPTTYGSGSSNPYGGGAP